ncbi:hypothetical protein BV898_07878 [Hypsibius exemplaris]|uniref:Mitochondrial import inner membrane translocase subunit Tim21 n=1 Tax=Hypsibius exemplaris TaxID=2072580 RepID=A0A1W0WSC2_HYPEX|nr:hypothetical protein BV898_07878 [Hypsibius exemplaris]
MSFLPVLDPLTRKLAQLAFGGALITTAFGLYSKRTLKTAYEDLQIYKDAVNLLTSNKHIKTYLGEPISIQGVDLTDRDISVTDDHCKLTVKVAGPISRGLLYMEAQYDRKIPPSATLTSVEFELEKPKGRIKLL